MVKKTIFLGTLLARLDHLPLVSSKLEFFGLGQLPVSEVSVRALKAWREERYSSTDS